MVYIKSTPFWRGIRITAVVLTGFVRPSLTISDLCPVEQWNCLPAYPTEGAGVQMWTFSSPPPPPPPPIQTSQFLRKYPYPKK
jgi:hypothetical protein